MQWKNSLTEKLNIYIKNSLYISYFYIILLTHLRFSILICLQLWYKYLLKSISSLSLKYLIQVMSCLKSIHRIITLSIYTTYIFYLKMSISKTNLKSRTWPLNTFRSIDSRIVLRCWYVWLLYKLQVNNGKW